MIDTYNFYLNQEQLEHLNGFIDKLLSKNDYLIYDDVSVYFDSTSELDYIVNLCGNTYSWGWCTSDFNIHDMTGLRSVLIPFDRFLDILDNIQFKHNNNLFNKDN